MPRPAKRDTDVVLSVGDLHVENFGVWRDSRNELVWGINDFDDACELPFTSDLVRLATSVVLAAADAKIDVSVDQSVHSCWMAITPVSETPESRS